VSSEGCRCCAAAQLPAGLQQQDNLKNNSGLRTRPGRQQLALNADTRLNGFITVNGFSAVIQSFF